MDLGYKALSRRQKNLRYGGYSAVATVIVAAVLVVVTLLAELLNFTVDLSANRLYTPGDTTRKVLDELEDEVAIYGLFSTGTEKYNYNVQTIQLAEQYANVCKKIEYETVDTLKDPDFIKQYLAASDSAAVIDDGSFMVLNKATGKYRILGLQDFYDYLDSESTGVDAFTAEEAFTSAIQYVTSEHTPIVYQLTGHGEQTVDSTFLSYMITTNTDFESLNLLGYAEKEIPVTNYTMIMIDAPMVDLSETEYALLLNYMERGGRMLVFLSYEMPDELPNFRKLLSRFGVGYSANGNYVRDLNVAQYVGNDAVIIPLAEEDSEVIGALAGDPFFTMIYAVPLELTESPSAYTEQEVFLQSSSSAIFAAKEELKQGPFPLGVYVSESRTVAGQAKTCRLIVFGNTQFVDLTNYGPNYIRPDNYKVVASSISMLQDDIDQLYITAKSLAQSGVPTTEGAFLTGFGIFVILIPAAILAAGLFVWARRKRL